MNFQFINKKQNFSCVGNSSCSNSIGSYSCECDPGFHGDGRQQCDDVDECSDLGSCVGTNEVCVNTIGSFRCDCELGYEPVVTSNGTQRCMNVDECEMGTDNCNRTTEVCVDIQGGFRCEFVELFLNYYQNLTCFCHLVGVNNKKIY